MRKTRKYVATLQLVGERRASKFKSQDELYEHLEAEGKNWESEEGQWVDAPPSATEKRGAPGVIHIRLNGNSDDVSKLFNMILSAIDKSGGKVINHPDKFYVNERRGTGGRIYGTVDIENMEK